MRSIGFLTSCSYTQAIDKMNACVVQVLDDDEEEEDFDTQEPLPTKKRSGKARQQVLLEDSDDDFAPVSKHEKAEVGVADSSHAS